MCGRTSLYVARTTIEERFDAAFTFDYEPRYNIAPTQNLATIRNTDPAHIVAQEWRLLPQWADDTDEEPRPINARAETAAENNMFKQAFAERRCLVLADGFYEWAGDRGGKTPYRVHLTDNQPFAMAGLWNRFAGDQPPLETVTILTTEPNDVVAPIHDRMPVVLERTQESTWLTGDADAARGVCEPYTGDDMTSDEVSTRVNDPSTDVPEVILPVEE